jgi:FolB domain-containing protein
MDEILIEELLVRCIIGITEEERREKQDVVLDIILRTDTRPAGQSDRFEDAVDYRAIKKRVYTMAEASRCYLVEALAEQVAGICLEHPKVAEVDVTVRKPSALRFARNVGVRIRRRREG